MAMSSGFLLMALAEKVPEARKRGEKMGRVPRDGITEATPGRRLGLGMRMG